MKKIILLFNTISYLKPKQIYYRLFYLIRSKFYKLTNYKYPLSVPSAKKILLLQTSIKSVASYEEKNKFTFLNLTVEFPTEIDWDYNLNGKLWTYNLNYFDYLNQANISKETSLNLIHNFIDNIATNISGKEAFPTSLRIINWIKFLSENNINNQKIDDSLYAQTLILDKNIEYHLCGNHVLENGFSLLFSSYYFNNKAIYAKAKQILETELTEQVLDDGAHYELSPMYHQLMLFRLLDSINLIQNNSLRKDSLLSFLMEKASVMLGWLQQISYNSGEVPLFNDTANNLAPTTIEILQYAEQLHINSTFLPLSQSGYRKVQKEAYTCLLDVGQIGPSYIPGHAHADTFNFELRKKNKAFIVDTGISTYQSNKRRLQEKGTSAHNTVEVSSTNSSEVWDSFKVGNRANIIHLLVSENSIESSHDGYQKKFNITHTRKWDFSESTISISDRLSQAPPYGAIMRLHFHPNVMLEEIKKSINLENLNYEISTYDYASEFNLLNVANVLEIYFEQELNVTINLTKESL